MTDSPNTPPPLTDLLARIAETRAIDTKKALEGIRARKLPIRNRRHSVSHKSYR